MNEYEAVRRQARGERRDYALDPRPLDDGRGGQGVVFRAVHKSSGVAVAFKRLNDPGSDGRARMRREIRVGRALNHRNVVPVLDSGDQSDWFVMPLAKGNAVAYRDRLAADDERLHRFVAAVGEGLSVAHERGWVHRDVKPQNILRLPSSEGRGRWALADWGLGRGPRGETTNPDRTRAGTLYGTEGFAAPELSINAHEATPAADIYSLGQVIGWVVTGKEPIANVPLLPADGPWRGAVRAATRHEPDDRPPTITALLTLVDAEMGEPAGPPARVGEDLLAEFRAGRTEALAELLALAEGSSTDVGLYIDLLPRMTNDEVRAAVKTSPPQIRELVSSMRQHLDSDWSSRPYKWADEVIRWLFRVARAAAAYGDWNLLEDAADAMCAWDASWDQWNPQNEVRPWLKSLATEPARIVARVFRRHPDSAVHFREILDDRKLDGRLRAALQGTVTDG